MARTFCGCLPTETVPFLCSRLHLASPSLANKPPCVTTTSLRMVRNKVTCATASSNPATGKREPRGIMRPRRVSSEMADLVGAAEIPRTQAVKLIWAYIKEHNLQDPDNKKIIVCDGKLKKIFGGRDQVGFLEIAGLISPHFLK